jgi:hypothetical protein
MKRQYLIAAGIVLALSILVGSLWFFIERGPDGRQVQALHAVPGDTVITLSWPVNRDASGYFVYRDGDPTPVDTDPITSTTYEDIGLTNGRTYTYTVAPTNSNATPGNRSDPVSEAPASK